MVLPGHIAGGYLFTRAFLALTHATFSASQTTALLIIGTLAGELPDIDLLRFYLANRSGFSIDHNHRLYATHAPLFWLIVSLIVVALGYIVSSPFVIYLGWIILSGSWGHLILDSIEDGVMWLWPFSRQRFALRNVPDFDAAKYAGKYRPGTFAFYWDYIWTVYIGRRVTFYVEIFITLAAIWVLFK
jgi:hypothetical protein